MGSEFGGYDIFTGFLVNGWLLPGALLLEQKHWTEMPRLLPDASSVARLAPELGGRGCGFATAPRIDTFARQTLV